MKNVIRSLSVFIFVLMIVSFKSTMINVFAAPETCGTVSDNPCVITSPTELAAIADHLDYYYVLGNDIDMEDFNWDPIGTFSNPFVGVLNGAGFTISNLSSNTVWEGDYSSYTMGMFGYVGGSAEIYNMGLNLNYNYDSSLDGENVVVGGLIGLVESSDTSIHDIWVSGSIDVTTAGGDEWASIGGLIGEALYQIIYGISFEGTITVGFGSESLYELSVGGILGYSEDTSLTNSIVFDSTFYIDSYNDGYVGGLVGYSEINESWMSEGGYDIVGDSVVDHLVINSIGYSTVGGVVAYVYNNSGEYNSIEDNWVKNSSFSDGTNYIGGISGYANGITLRENQVDSVIMGSDTIETDYLGGLVGNGAYLIIDRNRVSNLIIRAGDDSNAIGGAVGYLEYSTVNRTYVTGNLESLYNKVGGIAGETYDVKITNTSFYGTLSGSDYVGGLVGLNDGPLEIGLSWTNSPSDGMFYSTYDNIGGFIGYSFGDVNIYDSYSLATVSGQDFVGGFIGQSESYPINLETSYFGGEVNGYDSTDALIGYYAGEEMSIDSVFYDDYNGYSDYGEGAYANDFKSITSDVGLAFSANEFTDINSESPWFISPLVNGGYLGVFAGRDIVTFYDQSTLVGLELSWGEMFIHEYEKMDRISLYFLIHLNPNMAYSPYWGLKAIEPVDPKKADYVFGGWYAEPEFTNLWDFSESSDVDIALYAKWTAGVPNTGDLFGLSNALMGLGGLLIMATKRRRI